MSEWSIKNSIDHYGIENWGRSFFSVNEKGHVVVHPTSDSSIGIDLKELVGELDERGISAPVLMRFPDILMQRIGELNNCFRSAILEQGYKGAYQGVFPIKVNQERQVVESIIRYGREFNFGLEAGSKPELMATLAMLDSTESLFICNGYKDEAYIEMALMATKLGRKVIIVIEKLSELNLILKIAKRNNVHPILGVRAKLKSRGTGRWKSSSGDNSKFGLTPGEMLYVTNKLAEVDLLDSLQLLHFHIGSQVSNIRNVKAALQEAARFYCELRKLGAGVRYLDVGGGLGVDYNGSQSNTEGSTNYSIQEYANDVVFHVMEVCDDSDTEHPILVSESGRALTAHHSLLILKVLGVSKVDGTNGELLENVKLDDDTPNVIWNLHEAWRSVTKKNILETYHDANQMREESGTLFQLGYLSLEQRALADRLYWATCRKIRNLARSMKEIPGDLAGLERGMAGTYFCNFSVFQSIPDYWAIDHLFPIMPIHRLHEEPTKRGILGDLTCDSDGKIDQFIGRKKSAPVLALHPLNDEPYYLGAFLLGAYQEILGDLHNLFGDTHAVMVSLHENGKYQIEQVEEGDTVEDVLRYVSYDKTEMLHRLRSGVEGAVRAGRMTLEETRKFVRMYQDGMDGYTYLE